MEKKKKTLFKNSVWLIYSEHPSDKWRNESVQDELMLNNLKTGLLDIATLYKGGSIGYYQPDLIPDYIKTKVTMIFKKKSTSETPKKGYNKMQKKQRRR